MRLTGACRHKLNHPSLGIWSMTPMLLVGVISLCLWGISPSDFASFAHHFASFPHQICFISPKNCFISPTSCFISPTDCFISPTKFSLPHHYFASLCQKLEHNLLIFFPFFSSLELNFKQFFLGTADQSALSSFEQVVQSTSSSSSSNIVINYCFACSLNSSGARDASQITCLIQF